jgi:uncharacterized protein (TIRG00374 family)
MAIPPKYKLYFFNTLKFFVFLGIGTSLLYLVYQQQSVAFQEDCALKGIPPGSCSLLEKVITDFGLVNYWWILAVLLAFAISNISRAARWLMLLRPLGVQPRMSNAFFTIILGYFFNLALPRLGEIARSGAFARYERIPLEKVLGTVFVDRIFDVISILLITGIGFFLEYDTLIAFASENISLGSKIDGLMQLAWSLPLAAFVLLAALLLFRKRLQKTGIYKKSVGIIEGFWQGILTIRYLKQPWWFLFHSVNMWLMYFLMIYFCLRSFGPTDALGPAETLTVFIFGSWGIVIPSPGGMGTYHFLTQTALSIYGVAGEDGFSFANIAFLCINLGGNILMGLIALVILPLLNRDYAPEPLTR